MPSGRSSLVILFLSTRSHSYSSPCRLAIGVIVLCGTPSVNAYIPTLSSLYALHATSILSQALSSSALSLPLSLITDIGHFTIPAFTLSEPLIANSYSIGAFSIANV